MNAFAWEYSESPIWSASPVRHRTTSSAGEVSTPLKVSACFNVSHLRRPVAQLSGSAPLKVKPNLFRTKSQQLQHSKRKSETGSEGGRALPQTSQVAERVAPRDLSFKEMYAGPQVFFRSEDKSNPTFFTRAARTVPFNTLRFKSRPARVSQEGKRNLVRVTSVTRSSSAKKRKSALCLRD